MSGAMMAGSQPHLSTHANSPQLTWFGSQHWILLGGAQTGGRMTVVEGIYPSGSGTPPHVHHREDEMFEVLEGRFKFQAGDAFIEAGPGDVVWAPRGVKHAFTCISDPGMAGTTGMAGRLRFTVTPGGIDMMFAELAKLPDGPPDLAKVAEICGRYDIEFV